MVKIIGLKLLKNTFHTAFFIFSITVATAQGNFESYKNSIPITTNWC